MKIVKVFKHVSCGNTRYYIILDEEVEYTFEVINKNYVGIDKSGMFIKQYTYSPNSHEKAFGGFKFKLKMKNGEIDTICNNYWDSSYKEAHDKYGKSVDVAYQTIKDGHNAFCGTNILESVFNKILKEQEILDFKEYADIRR